MYNEEMLIQTYIERVINTLSDHFTNYELILIDDGSTDETESLCSSYIKDNKFIRSNQYVILSIGEKGFVHEE